MLSLHFALRFPDMVRRVIPIACGLEVTVLQTIHNLEQIYAIETDPNFSGGHYYDGERPNAGLAHARMISHKTFLSLRMMERRARSELAVEKNYFSTYTISSPIESYMLHQGAKFVHRFDANTYIRIINAWQQYNLLRSEAVDSYETLFERSRQQRFLVFSIDSDVCYYPDEQAQLVETLKLAGVPVQHITVHSDKGHDSFLLEADLFGPYISYMLGDNAL
jgi:homoserine O-acetyltransferase